MTPRLLESGRPLPASEIKILLVDDQPARLMSYETILEGLGYGMVRASSGLQALEQLMKEEFAVILLDVSMPGMDGFETASLIHEHPRFERTPIIFVTGVNVSELDQLKGYRLGAVDYVHVPVVPEILRSKVSVLVELYCKRRELQSLNEELAATNEELAASNRALALEKARELEALNRDLKIANVELEEAIRALQAEVDVRAAVEEQLKAADRHKDEFLAMLAHELRNPLAPIRNAVHILRARMSADSEVRWVQDVIDRQLGSLTRLVDDLLDVSRITRGKINISRGAVELGAILSSAVETVQPLLSEKQHRLSLDVPEPELLLDGDLTRLTQAIGNILSNAAKYTGAGGAIQLSGRRDGEYVEISVRDDGTGISAEDLPRIFDLFTQGEQNDQHGLGGLGIGLALVRRLVELHGGTVVA
ncbi:MAG TPA: hybrid sensor histidine kinase/response regulator, partial [Steroidobacteraceae bacterium]|nr:hybrid sensor histidine kinase/response regulator [Steroidobacteraceae bacterium]